jgi:peroxiredoxin
MTMKKLINISVIFLYLIAVSATAKDLKIGDKAPEIKLANIKGETIALSSLRNKVVLVDFWGTWCAPCVKEQTHLSALYKKYKNNGFEIYAVSLDNKKEQWQNIIKKYKIDWIQVSDLKFWLSPVTKLYNIQELPFNVLINGEGVIVGINLHGDNLEKEIKKLLIKK